MTDELNPEVEANEAEAPVVDLCDRCECADCPGVDPNSTERLAAHSKACAVKHF